MATITKENHQVDNLSETIDLTHEVSVKTFLDACSEEELDEVYDYLENKGLIEEKEVEEVEVEVGFDFPDDGSYSDSELNNALTKISDARLQLTNDDLEELKRIAGKYR